MLLSAAPLGEACASAWAQGGMAAALGGADSPSLHGADTLAAGAALCEPHAVEILTHEGPNAVRALAALGAPFDRTASGGFVLSLEAAHSRARVARVGGDGAGRAIMNAVITRARASAHVEIRENVRVRALLQDVTGRVIGVLAETEGVWVRIRAAAVILATGGLGGLYAVTTNPRSAIGEGLAMAVLAGATILDPEFVQFHPTAMDLGQDPAPLATEALRGEGARLVTSSGEAFMRRYDPAGDLAPRDVVARAIETEIAAGAGAFLDAREAVGADFEGHFPAVFAVCMAAGLDPRRQPIPVRPAAHYHMGGIETDLFGRTSLGGLFAVGECAATGVHGANRLASNSLLEAAVFGARAGRVAREATASGLGLALVDPPVDLPGAKLARLRALMSRDAGVVRSAEGLSEVLAWIDVQAHRHGLALPLVTARLVARAALDRRESRGGHFRGDYPETLAQPIHTRILAADDSVRRSPRAA
jgi:L-aspartate oxidase